MGLSVGRKLLLAARRTARALAGSCQRYGFRLGASRFVAGESLDAAVPVLRSLNDKGLLTNTTLLGEGVTTEAETAAVVAAYRELLDRIAAERPAHERRAEAHASRPRVRRGARAPERR